MHASSSFIKINNASTAGVNRPRDAATIPLSGGFNRPKQKLILTFFGFLLQRHGQAKCIGDLNRCRTPQRSSGTRARSNRSPPAVSGRSE